MAVISINNTVFENIELIIFDKDGTLIDLYCYWSHMIFDRVALAQKRFRFDESCKKRMIYAMGVDTVQKKLRSEGPVGLKKREIVMQAMIDTLAEFGFSDTFDSCVEIFQETDKESIKKLPDIVKPIKGMRDLLDSLCECGCTIAIATADKTDRAQLAMQTLHITDKVNLVVGDDMVNRSKPAPDMIELILAKVQIKKDNAIMVGDSQSDLLAGKNVGLRASIGVETGLTTKEVMLSVTPYVIPDISFITVS